jgi:Cu+-exporting ATPase
MHPHSVRIANYLNANELETRSFVETAGCGIQGSVAGHQVMLGSAAWLANEGIRATTNNPGSAAHVSIDGHYRGVFILPNSVRDGAAQMISELGHEYHLALLSGDNDRERSMFEKIFGPTANLRFNQGPIDKLEYVRQLQSAGKRPMMIGDGLNDAGALKQSDVGVAVVESISAFSPASDIIMRADRACQLPAILRFSKGVTRIIKVSFGISSIYNLGGIAIAASAKLAPIVCAILMPLSSISVVVFACAATTLYARHLGLTKDNL